MTFQQGEPPLHHIRVIDFGHYIAGPLAAMLLADQGAEVIKIDSPQPLHGPLLTCWYGIEVNRGKRSVLLDLKTREGRDAFWRLVETVDVVVHNFTPGVIERLGIDYAQARLRNPRIIYGQITAYDGPCQGLWSQWPGYDPVIQAAAGIMSRYGTLQHPELHAISCVDYLTGFMNAFGIALALFKRRRDGQGDCVKTTLAQAAHLTHLTLMHGYEDDTHPIPTGQEAVGETALQRLYKAQDGWFFLGAKPEQLPTLLSWLTASGRGKRSLTSDDLSPTHGALARELARHFRTQRLEHVQCSLGALDIAVQPVLTIDDIHQARRRTTRHGSSTYAPPATRVMHDPEHPCGFFMAQLASTYLPA